MAKTYAIPDLHGRFDLLLQAFESIGSHAGLKQGTVVMLGDYIDRGPASMQIIQFLMSRPLSGRRLISLKGNHEDMMQKCCRDNTKLNWWIGNGGDATLISYGQRPGDFADLSCIPAAHFNWVDQLPLMYVDKHRVFVHAGVDPTRPLAEQDEQDLLWKRYADSDRGGHGTRHVVHGHSADQNGPRAWEGRTALDTLAWSTGRLVVGVFDDELSGGPVDYLEVFAERN